MNVRLLRAMQKCCAKEGSPKWATLGMPVLTQGEICATDSFVAVRYHEKVWEDLELPQGDVAVPMEELKALSPSTEVTLDPAGFMQPHGRILGETIDSYPDCHRLWETLTRPVSTLDAKAPMTDPKHLRRVLAVFEAAKIKPVIENRGAVLVLEGFDGTCEIQAIVAGCRR